MTPIRWFTTLLGKKSSLKPLIAVLRRLRVCQVRVCALRQGLTTRWCLGWTWTARAATKMPRAPLTPKDFTVMVELTTRDAFAETANALEAAGAMDVSAPSDDGTLSFAISEQCGSTAAQSAAQHIPCVARVRCVLSNVYAVELSVARSYVTELFRQQSDRMETIHSTFEAIADKVKATLQMK